MNHRHQRVQLETDRYKITGTVTLPADEHHGRLSDLLNSRERDFIALTDVVIEALAGGPEERREFSAVSRAHIVVVSEID